MVIPKWITTANTINANQSLIIRQLLIWVIENCIMHEKPQCVNQKKTRRSGFWLFLLRGISYPRLLLGGQSELFVVCIYGFCVYGRVSPALRVLLSRAVHSVTCCPVETMAGPSKAYCKITCENIETPGWSVFRIHTAICLWWTWRESNPRPEHFSLCFIQQ